jgi:predicted RNase H-like nuclease (RuvC/YqgF family)
MAKALKPLVIVLLVLSIVSLVLGTMLFFQRGEIKDRVQKNELAVVKIAENLHIDGLDAAQLAEQLKNVQSMQVALDGVSVSALNRYEELQNTKNDLATKIAELDKTVKELATTKTELTASQAKVTELTDTLAQKEAEVAQAKSQIDQLQQDKTALQTQIDDLNNQLVKAEEEMRDLQDQVTTLNKIVDETTQSGPKALPIGLTGKISVVNADWNFVVLDIGSDSGLVRDAQMLVHRADKLIGKVRITNVQKNMAIAEIMMDWEQSPIREGDYVLY